MRKFVIVGLLLIMALAGMMPAVTAQEDTGALEPGHLVLSLDSGGAARVNRMDWDVNAFAPVHAGTTVRGSDYVDLSGRTTVYIVCTDLTLLTQRGSEAPRCDPYPSAPAFYYLDDPTWLPAEGAITVVTQSGTTVPAEVTTADSHNRNELVGDELTQVTARTDAILGLELDASAKAFALASFYRTEGMYYDALTTLAALPDLGCTARRPSVDAPDSEPVPLVQSPSVYVRIGELYQLLGQPEDALRNYRCAASLSEALEDPANTALSYARQGNLVQDPGQAVQFYQIAIDNYATLGAQDNLNAMAEICGLRNCTVPE